MVQNIESTRAGEGASLGDGAVTFGEEAIWLHERLRFQNNSRCMIVDVLLEGPLDAGSLGDALSALLERHANLRANYLTRRGRPVRVENPPEPVPVDFVDLGDQPPEEQDRRSAERIQELSLTPFLLSKGALLKAELQRFSSDRHRLVLALHQILLDDGTVPVLVQKLAEEYGARRGGPAPRRSTASYASHAERLRRAADGSHEAYWKQKLAPVSYLQLPYARARASSSITRKGSRRSRLRAETVSQVRALAAECGVEPSAIYLGVLATLVHRYSGQHVFHLGALTTTKTSAELDVIGFFGVLLPVCVDMKGSPSFYDVAGHVSDVLGDALAKSNVSPQVFDDILRRKAQAPFPPPFQVIFEHRDAVLRPVDAGGLRFTPAQHVDNQLAAFDIALAVLDSDAEAELVWEYNADLFAESTLEALDQHFHTLLAHALRTPHAVAAELALRSEAEAKAWAKRSSPLLPATPDDFLALELEESSTLVGLFEAQVTIRGDAPAVVCGGRTLSYRELDARTNGLARRLVNEGVTSSRCGLLLPQSELSVIAALGIMKAHDAYVPLDASMPLLRLQQIANDAELGAIVTEGASRDLAGEIVSQRAQAKVIDLDEVEPGDAPPLDALDPDQAAYVLYTSGSTGTPKGVVQSHRNACFHAATWCTRLGISPSDHVSLIPTFAWDSAFQDTFGALLSGATLFPFDLRASGIKTLLEWLREQRISVVHMVVPLFREVARATASAISFETVRMLALGGDLIFEEDVELYRQKFPDTCWLANAYGATESSSGLMSFADKSTKLEASSMPLGYPPPGVEVTLLNEAGEQCAVHGVGEIVLRSPHLSLGYWGDRDLSLRKFESLPTKPGYRQFRMGDHGRLLPSGSIQYVGRKDFQLKIRGYRVELGEIEAALSAHPDVAEAVVQAFEDANRTKTLVAFVRVDEPAEGQELAIREFLRARLPEYMVPSQLAVVDELPRTTTGKIDRKALKAPRAKAALRNPERDDPKTPTERRLRELWAQVLECEPDAIAREQNFFEIGGHSIIAMALLARMYEVELLPHDLAEERARLLFEKPTLFEMAQWVDESRSLASGTP